MIDLLVVRPHLPDEQRVTWDEQDTDLAEAMRHWAANETRLCLRDAEQAAPAHDDELAAAPWWLLAGRRIAGLAFNEPAATPTPETT